VNQTVYENEEHCVVKRYEFPTNYDLKVKVKDLAVDQRKYGDFEAEIENVEVCDPDLSSSVGLTTRKKTSISSSLRKVRPSISSSLILNKPRKIIFKTGIIEIKKPTPKG
jgi:hypothetical protein